MNTSLVHRPAIMHSADQPLGMSFFSGSVEWRRPGTMTFWYVFRFVGRGRVGQVRPNIRLLRYLAAGKQPIDVL